MVVDRPFYAIAPTQFSPNGQLDAGAVADNVTRIAKEGIDRILLTGAYGEFQSLTDEERIGLVTAVRSRNHKTQIMAGAAHPSTEATASLANSLFEAGADQVMVAPPMLAELSNGDVVRHFEHLAANVDGPLAIYNNPIFGHDLQSEVLTHVASMPAYRAIKQGTPLLARMVETVAIAHASSGTSLMVLAASDVAALAMLGAGADGLTSTNVWIFPAALQALARMAATANNDHAERIHAALSPYFQLVKHLGQPRTVKAAMQLRGFGGSDFVRLPYVSLSKVEHQMLIDTLRQTDEGLAAIANTLDAQAS